MEPECKNERNSLVKLIKRFKVLLNYIVKNNNIDIANDEHFKSLKSFYEDLDNKLIDPDYFHCLLGREFENQCPEVNEDEDEEEEDNNE